MTWDTTELIFCPICKEKLRITEILQTVVRLDCPKCHTAIITDKGHFDLL